MAQNGLHTDDAVRAKQDRMLDVFAKRPEAALKTETAQAVVEAGLRCDFRQGDLTAVMDMPEILGGTDAGPSPGFFGRAALCGCVAMGIKQTAIQAGVALHRVSVDMEMDFDNAAMFGRGCNSAAPLDTRLVISIESDEPDDRVAALVETALSADPWFLALRDAQKVSTDTRVTRPSRG